MQLAMIGLGRMGAALVRRLMRDGHECVVYDIHPDAAAELVAEGAIAATSLPDLVARLTAPRTMWIMVPAAVTGPTVDGLVGLLDPGDVVIDGGNSYYRHDIERAATLQEKGLHFVDVGTSGGVFGLDRGFCLMIGGEPAVVEGLDPIFRTLASGAEAAVRTAGRCGAPDPAENGYLHCGPAGAGHFVKMVHNGIEYGMMAAYAEGLAILNRAGIGALSRPADAETAPLANPEFYRYDLDLARIAEVWRRGSVVSSWLLDLTAAALAADPEVTAFSGRVSDSGEGRWSVMAAVEEGVPAHVLTAALYERFSSRGEAGYADRLLSALRQQFGGHAETPAAVPAGPPPPPLLTRPA